MLLYEFARVLSARAALLRDPKSQINDLRGSLWANKLLMKQENWDQPWQDEARTRAAMADKANSLEEFNRLLMEQALSEKEQTSSSEGLLGTGPQSDEGRPKPPGRSTTSSTGSP